jgi:hypothetical protein
VALRKRESIPPLVSRPVSRFKATIFDACADVATIRIATNTQIHFVDIDLSLAL